MNKEFSFDEKSLKAFGAGVQRLIDGQDLAFDEAYRMFCDVLGDRQPSIHQGAFLAALAAKGETTEEIVAVWKAICDMDTARAEIPGDAPLTDNSGTGMDTLKTFNVSSAAAVVAAACGARMARHGARALTSSCGTVDILESVGLDVECEISIVEESIVREGIGLFNGMSPKVHPGGLGRLLRHMRFGSILNIAASLANPARPTCGLRGVHSESMVEPVSELMPAIGYSRGMVVFGKAAGREGGMDEISLCGETLVSEFSPNATPKKYSIRPEDFGIRASSFGEIAATGTLSAERSRFLEVLAGVGPQACIDFTCLNSGAALYVNGSAGNIGDGVKMSYGAISSGAAVDKLRRWVAVQNTSPRDGLSRLDSLLCGIRKS